MASLNDSMTAGVWLEFFDASGRCVGRTIYLDWRGKPVPVTGDTLSAEVECDNRRVRLQGVVQRRHFELQQTDAGRSEVWVRIEAEVTTSRPRAGLHAPQGYLRSARFSDN